MEKIPMTRAGFAALDEELKMLKSVERPAVIRAIAEAREHAPLGSLLLLGDATLQVDAEARHAARPLAPRRDVRADAIESCASPRLHGRVSRRVEPDARAVVAAPARRRRRVIKLPL